MVRTETRAPAGGGANRRPAPARGEIDVWAPPALDGVELRRGVAVGRPVPRHFHEEYQICLVSSGGGEMAYRGRTIPTPPASLFLVFPGEVHANRSRASGGCSYRDMFVGAARMREAAAETCGRDAGLPFFETAVVFDADVVERYRRAHVAIERGASALEADELLLGLLASLVARFSECRPAPTRAGSERRAVDRAREYLAAHYADTVRSADLARVAGLSPFHLSRVFARQLGMPPHAFQTQMRVVRAKALLGAGVPAAEVAAKTGFFDQSHLTRHFKRIVGVPPGRYR